MMPIKKLIWIAALAVAGLAAFTFYGHVTACEGVAVYEKCRDFFQ
jgi:hypothetical protein